MRTVSLLVFGRQSSIFIMMENFSFIDVLVGRSVYARNHSILSSMKDQQQFEKYFSFLHTPLHLYIDVGVCVLVFLSFEGKKVEMRA